MRKHELKSSLSVFVVPSTEEITQNLQNVNFSEPKLLTTLLPSLLHYAGQESDYIRFSTILVTEIMTYTDRSGKRKIQLKLPDIYRIIDLFVPDITESNRVKDFVKRFLLTFRT